MIAKQRQSLSEYSEASVRRVEAKPFRNTFPQMTTKVSGLTRVLVIDDHHDGGECLGMLLKHMGCDVRIARRGSEAIASAPAFRPQLVITDINMPGLNGYETVKRLKEQSWAGSAVFVAHSAVPPGVGDSASAVTLFYRYITKPGAPADFEAVLAQVRSAGFAMDNGSSGQKT